MSSHHFTLIVEGPDLDDDALLDALYEHGCDDALVGRSHGVQYLDFDREAPSLDDAVLSAVADVERVDGVEVVRIADAGLVSMADIAARVGRTRESVRLLIEGERGPGGFPAPVFIAINAGLELRRHSGHVGPERRGDLRQLVGL